jgi:hypothetical protein
MSKTTIRLDGDTTKAALDDIKTQEGHSTMDSVLKALLRDHTRVEELEQTVDDLRTQTRVPVDDDVAATHEFLNLSTASPVPEPMATEYYGGSLTDSDEIPRLFRLFVRGPWLYNGQAASDPAVLDVVFASGGFLFRYSGNMFTGRGVASTEPVAFYVSRDAFEDEVLGMLAGDAEFLLPPDGLRTTTRTWTTEYECVPLDYGGAEWWPVLGGYGRDVTDAELDELLGLRTVDEAIRTDGAIAYREHQTSEAERAAENEHRAAANKPLKVASGLHITTPTQTLEQWWEWATRQSDWSPHEDITLGDLLPADPVETTE